MNGPAEGSCKSTPPLEIDIMPKRDDMSDALAEVTLDGALVPHPVFAQPEAGVTCFVLAHNPGCELIQVV
jgi:hypothetical protein